MWYFYSYRFDLWYLRMFYRYVCYVKCASFICSRSFSNVDARALVWFGKFSLLLKYSPRSIYKNSNLTQRLSQLGHFSTFGLVFFVLKSLLGIKSQGSIDKIAFLSLTLGVIEREKLKLHNYLLSWFKIIWAVGTKINVGFYQLTFSWPVRVVRYFKDAMEILFLRFFSASGPFMELACFVWRLKNLFFGSFSLLRIIKCNYPWLFENRC